MVHYPLSEHFMRTTSIGKGHPDQILFKNNVCSLIIKMEGNEFVSKRGYIRPIFSKILAKKDRLARAMYRTLRKKGFALKKDGTLLLFGPRNLYVHPDIFRSLRADVSYTLKHNRSMSMLLHYQKVE